MVSKLPETSSMAAPSNEIATVVLLPLAGATLRHGKVREIGATRLVVKLCRRSVDSLGSVGDSSDSLKTTSSSTPPLRLQSHLPSFSVTDTECTFSAETGSKGSKYTNVTLQKWTALPE